MAKIEGIRRCFYCKKILTKTARSFIDFKGNKTIRVCLLCRNKYPTKGEEW